MAKTKTKPVSNYTILNRWMFDGNQNSTMPLQLIDDKSISPMYVLYYFQMSKYSTYINKVFNNYYIFSMSKIDMFKFLKKCSLLSGYKPPFLKRTPKKKSQMVDALKVKYPYLKREEVFMLVDFIDASNDKDTIYEMFGFYTPKKKKVTNAEKKQLEKEKEETKSKEINLNSLIGNFG